VTVKPKQRQTIEEILVRASEVMYPHLDPHLIAVDARDSDGDTPLHKVALWGDNYAAALLMDAGAEVDALGDMGCTPLYFAVMNGHEHVVATLLKRGADPDIRSELGSTPRELALRSENKVLQALFRE
jgi:ankyrin repeat protein